VRLSPPTDPDLDGVQELLGDFARFWRSEPNPAERRKLIASLFDHVWQDSGRIVAVKPRPAFAPYSKAIDEARPRTPKADRKRGVTKTGATGVEPAIVTSEIAIRV
jgi:hypothetical protein